MVFKETLHVLDASATLKKEASMFATAKDNTLKNEKNDMINEGGRASDDFKEGVRRVKSDTREAIGAVKEDIDGMARDAGRRVRELADTAGHNVTDAMDTVTAKVRDNPVQSTLIALGIGFVVGALFRR
jgi:ElaB/YqjD/DUF883 family membrane-anchored ribosome-binding protein